MTDINNPEREDYWDKVAQRQQNVPSGITIPAGALEAGARLLCKRAGYDWTVTPSVHEHWREEARAAFLAMVGNWEGMGIGPAVEKSFGIPRPHLMLPLPQETTDGK